MGKPSAPKPADPVKTASAQTGSNVSTAVANSYLNNVNQVTPDGSLTYTTSGYKDVYDPVGKKTYKIPITTATQTLSAGQQALKAESDQTQMNLATLGKNQSARLDGLLSKPVNLNNDAIENRLMDLGRRRLDPMMQRNREALDQKLANQGIGLGSRAYEQAVGMQGQQENDAYNSLLLQGRQQSISEIMQERNQPLNEISALLSGSQIQNPNFVNANNYGIPTTDFAGIQANYDNGMMNRYNSQMGAWQSGVGGLLGLGANLLSDKRAKDDVKRVGKTNDGTPIYTYKYKTGGPTQMGVMAQELKKKKPGAVKKTASGLLAVDYSKV